MINAIEGFLRKPATIFKKIFKKKDTTADRNIIAALTSHFENEEKTHASNEVVITINNKNPDIGVNIVDDHVLRSQWTASDVISCKKTYSRGEESISFDDAAESHIPKEKIHKSDAPPVPKTLHEAVNGKFGKYFKKAMLVEMKSLMDKGVWEVVKPPENRKLIRSKWVFAYKTDPNDFITRFKARLVAVGYSQIPGEDFTDTFSPVVKIRSIRMLLVYALQRGLKIEQLDVETAYLYGTLQIPNYMKTPPGFQIRDKDGTPMVCKLLKSLYGLHQSGREWYECITGFLRNLKFEPLQSDTCILTRGSGGDKVILSLYVDDVVTIAKTSAQIEQFKNEIQSEYSIVDGGEADWVLKIQISRYKDGLLISQPAYAENILRDAEMWDKHEGLIADTPMMCTWVHNNDSPALDPEMQKWYHSFTMKLAYLAQCTRPDLSYTANILAQWQSNANEGDLRALKRALKYLRNTYDYGLWYPKNPTSTGKLIFSGRDTSEEFVPTGYADASYANDEGCKSRSGYAFFVNGCLINWFSKKQPVVALSSTEAEIIAFVEAVKECLCLRQMIGELDRELEVPSIIAQDNQSAIAICLDPIQHARVKHMDVRQFFVRDHLTKKDIEMVYCPTEEMVADIFTKALPKALHCKFMDTLGMRSKKSTDLGHRKLVKLAVKK